MMQKSNNNNIGPTAQEWNNSPFGLGYKAYNDQKGIMSNPFPKGSKEYDLWLSGWLQNDRESQ